MFQLRLVEHFSDVRNQHHIWKSESSCQGFQVTLPQNRYLAKEKNHTRKDKQQRPEMIYKSFATQGFLGIFTEHIHKNSYNKTYAC